MHSAIRHPIIIPGIEAISIASDRTFPRHSHDEFGFGVVERGGQQSWSGRGWVEAKAGDVITVNPGELHDGIGREGSPRHWRMLFVSPHALTNLLGMPASKVDLESPVLRTPDTSRLVLAALNAAICDDADANGIEEALILASHGVIGSPELLRKGTSISLSRPVARVLEQIRFEADLPLALSDYATTSGLSRYQILRHFSAEVGATPHAYLVQHRVKIARRAIAVGASLADAALSAGFADQSHMTRAFARQIGISPGRYRDQ